METSVELAKWGIGGLTIAAIFWKFIPSLFEFLSKQKANPHVARASDDSGAVSDAVRDLIAAEVRVFELQVKQLRDDLQRYRDRLQGLDERINEVRDLARDCASVLRQIRDD